MDLIFANSNLLDRVLAFLPIKDLLRFMTTSKHFTAQIQKYLRFLLESQGLIRGNTLIPPHILFRGYYARETYFWSFDDNIKPFKRKHTLGLDVAEIRVGLTFSALLTHSQQLFYCPTQEYTDAIQNKPNFSKIEQVKQFSVLGKGRLLYLTENGHLGLIFENKEQIILYENVEKFESSYYLCVLFFKKPKQPQLQEEIESGRLLDLQDATIENVKQQQRERVITGLNQEVVAQIAVTAQQFYILTATQKVFASEVYQKNQIVLEQSIKMVEVPFFNNKHIIILKAGLNYALALGREEIKSIVKWSNEQVVEWLGQQGFADYQNIVKYNEYTGKEFAELAPQKQFKNDTLGLQKEDLCIKLNTEIVKASQESYKPYQLFGWGKNDFGQLAVPLSNNVQYSKLNLPQLDEEDEIVQIECGWKNTSILTERGKIFLTENQQIAQKLEKERERQAQLEKQQNDDENGKQKRKKSRQMEQKEQQKEPGPNKNASFWQDISRVFVKETDKRLYRNHYINLSKDVIVILCTIYEKRAAQTYFRELLEGNQNEQDICINMRQNKRFKPAEQILHRILWDPELKKEEFIVGYEDRFLGIMEITIDEYVGSQVKSHRIQYYKRNNKIVWDRQKRVDLL